MKDHALQIVLVFLGMLLVIGPTLWLQGAEDRSLKRFQRRVKVRKRRR